MIIGEIRRYLRDNNAVRVSRSMRDTAYRAMQIKEQLTVKNNCEPTVEEIAKITGRPGATVRWKYSNAIKKLSEISGGEK